MKEYKDKKARKDRKRSPAIMIAAGVIIALIAAALIYYIEMPTSNTVYCGVLEYEIFKGISISGTHSITQNETMTTMVTYTTTTNLAGPIGRTVSNITTTSSAGIRAGVETICKYIPTPSSTSIGSSSGSSTSSAK